MHSNTQLITDFYLAFQQGDAEAMAACYAPDVHFSDPVFTELHGAQAGDMWRMLTAGAKEFSLVFDGVQANDQTGCAHWVASYTFSKTGRRVVNDIQAKFVFQDGKIVRHQDSFNLWSWSRQALGLKGLLLGATPMVQNAIRQQAAKSLALYRHKTT